MNVNMDHINIDSEPTYVTSVKEKTKGFTQRQIRNAMMARKLQNVASLTTTGIISVVDRKND